MQLPSQERDYTSSTGDMARIITDISKAGVWENMETQIYQDGAKLGRCVTSSPQCLLGKTNLEKMISFKKHYLLKIT